MAAIGGVFNVNGAHCNSDVVVRMSKSMNRRGGGSRSAVMLGACGLFWGDGQTDSALSELGSVILLCDGRVSPWDGGASASFFGEGDARLCVSAFAGYGVGFSEHLSGEYAIAAYDRQKEELVLFRNGDGGRPLFYAVGIDSVGFASEIKGVVAFLGEARVKRSALVSHVLSRYGQYSGEDLYCNINDVRSGRGVVISRGGCTPFDSRQIRTAGGSAQGKAKRRVGGELICPDEEGMSRLLCEILYAFDYPQFDYLMPTFLRDCVRWADEGGEVIDGALCFDLEYASERRDRLSIMAGYRPVCVPPDTYTPKEKEMKNMERVLLSLMSRVDRHKLEYIFETDIVSEIMKIENTARRIRCLGMAIQCDVWYEGYRILLE